MRPITQIFGLALFLTIQLGCDSSINKSVYVQDGERRDSGVNTVNGSITIGNDCVIRGDCRTVNGSIRVGQNSHVQALQVINGNIELLQNVKARDDVATVNGAISLHSGANVTGDVQAINGNLDMDHALVGQDLTLYNGDVELINGSVVKGDIVVKNSKGHRPADQFITIRLSDSSAVEGDITVLEKVVKVKVYLSKEAKVGGDITGAEVIREI
jgi:DUF4097 and DUF4098 domain-containing protein YvlB